MKEIDKIIRNIRFNCIAKKYKFEVIPKHGEIIGQETLSKIAGVSRHTVAWWEKNGIIRCTDIGLNSRGYFQIKEVISQLENLKKQKT